MVVEQIVSGGQTGVDRAALDVAIELGIPCGGWCPRGRRAEDGPISPRYPLRQTLSAAYEQRTERNVADSDATLICNVGELSGGTMLTYQTARLHGKPCFVATLDRGEPAAWADELAAWLRRHRVRVLNVAGPRASAQPHVYDQTHALLSALLA